MSPAESEEQRQLAGIALAIKTGRINVGDPGYSEAAAQMASSMTVDQLRDFARKPKARVIG